MIAGAVMRAGAGLLIGATMMLTACENGDDGRSSSRTNYDLIIAAYPECQENGRRVARYLDTGQPTGLDPEYGDWRQQVLELSGERRALAIRQYAAEVIQACDEKMEHAAEEARRSAEAAQASRLAEIELRKAQRRYRIACENLGGRVVGNGLPFFSGPNHEGCVIDYPQWSEGWRNNANSSVGTFHIPLDENGKLHRDKYERLTCTEWQATGGGNWWHEDTQVCAIPAQP